MLFLIVKVVWLQQQSFFIKHQLEAEANLTFNSMHFGLSFALSVQHSHDHFFLERNRLIGIVAVAASTMSSTPNRQEEESVHLSFTIAAS
jgi:hypothetical protein